MAELLQLFLDHMETPIGKLLVVADGNGSVRAIDWFDYEARMLRLLRLHYGASRFRLEPADGSGSVTSALTRYFAGDFAALETLRVQTAGTPFQNKVWSALRQIPAGTTVSYGALAKRIGQPSAVRAVGLANGSNPVGIVTPCHRVIGSDGSLTGYGGGIERKRWLLEHERSVG